MIKQDREEFLGRWSHISIVRKVRVTVSNGFSLIGLTESELGCIMEALSGRSVDNSTKREKPSRFSFATIATTMKHE
jgi:hypothetical protein